MSAGGDRLILVGRVAGAFGVKGEVRLTAYTASPQALLDYRVLRDATGAPVLTLQSGRPFKGGIIARAAEVPTREAAEALRGLQLHVRREDLPEPDEDEYYLTDLVGLMVEDLSGTRLGSIKAVVNFGAGDLLEIAPATGGASWYAPFTRAAVPEVRLGDGVVRLDPDAAGIGSGDDPED